jgi:cytoskeletal protein RodZ
MTEATISENIATATPGPGARLRQIRLEKKLSIQQVADKVHLLKEQIEALENDDYFYAPALAYVRGHLRLYAQFIGAPINEILNIFDNLGLKEPKRDTKTFAAVNRLLVSQQKELPVRGNRKIWASIGGVLIGIALILAFIWMGHHFHKQVVSASGVKKAPVTATLSPASTTETINVSGDKGKPVSLILPANTTPSSTSSAAASSERPPSDNNKVE